jgi:hypothetical protein
MDTAGGRQVRTGRVVGDWQIRAIRHRVANARHGTSEFIALGWRHQFRRVWSCPSVANWLSGATMRGLGHR